jgi:ribosomal protein S18 acetylase RimI-like enzyme
MLEAPSMDETEKFVLGNLAAGNPQFVAITDNKVVGWCDISPKPRLTLKHSGVLGMGVIEAYRGRGIGKSLLDATLQAAKAKGLTRIELMVRTDNIRARKLYEALGFVVEGLCKHHMYIDNIYIDSHLMAVIYETV